LHYREAARWALYTWQQFCDLSDDEQAAVVAHYETIRKIEAIESNEQNKEAKRAAKKRR
jgi:hypothetical protein